MRPRLAAGARVRRDSVRDCDVLLFPEGAVMLNHTAAAVLKLCDGSRTREEIALTLMQQFSAGDIAADVDELLDDMTRQGLVVNDHK